MTLTVAGQQEVYHGSYHGRSLMDRCWHNSTTKGSIMCCILVLCELSFFTCPSTLNCILSSITHLRIVIVIIHCLQYHVHLHPGTCLTKGIFWRMQWQERSVQLSWVHSKLRSDHPGQGLFLQWRPPRWMYPAATTKLEIVFQSCSTTKKRETLFQSCSTRSGDWHLHTLRLHLVSRELHIVINYPLANCHCHNSLPSMNDHDDNNDDDDSHWLFYTQIPSVLLKIPSILWTINI